MQRDKWSFEFKSEELAKAATAKIEFHNQRLEFWKGAQEQVMKDVRASGLNIEESAAGASYSNKSGYGPEITVDMTYQRKLSEANAKIKEHHGKVGEYTGWAQVLEGNKGRTYTLNADDYLFFFGK